MMQIRPLSADDKMGSFDCGKPALNNWLINHAAHNQREGTSRTSVVVVEDRVVGFLAVSTGEIERVWLPKSYRRNKPDPVPVFLIGQLAVHVDSQGMGVGKSLLRFAMGTALEISLKAGCYGVVTQPLDEEARQFYHSYGFADLPGDSKRRLFVRMVDIAETAQSLPVAN